MLIPGEISNSPHTRYGSGETQRMEASKLIDGSGTVPLAKSGQPSAVLRLRRSIRNRPKKQARQNVRRLRQSENRNRRSSSAAIAGATTWLPASSSDEIADAANVSASATGRRFRPKRRRSRSRSAQDDARGRARKKLGPLSIPGRAVPN